MNERTTHAVPVPKGYRLGAWEIREPIASGGFGTVYTARRVEPAEGLPSEAALKFLPTGTRTPASCAISRNSPSGRRSCCAGSSARGSSACTRP